MSVYAVSLLGEGGLDVVYLVSTPSHPAPLISVDEATIDQRNTIIRLHPKINLQVHLRHLYLWKLYGEVGGDRFFWKVSQ